jgi:hypothetical protein
MRNCALFRKHAVIPNPARSRKFTMPDSYRVRSRYETEQSQVQHQPEVI